MLKTLIASWKGIQDSLEFWIPRRGFRSDSMYCIPVFVGETWILDSNR